MRKNKVNFDYVRKCMNSNVEMFKQAMRAMRKRAELEKMLADIKANIKASVVPQPALEGLVEACEQSDKKSTVESLENTSNHSSKAE